MRLVFAGTPVFAERALSALIDAGHEVALVLTQPDRPAGRGMRVHDSPVKRLARSAGIEVMQPASLRDAEPRRRVSEVRAEVLVVAAYGLMVPQAMLEAAPRGGINIHASLLPRWRGAAPIQRALLAGDVLTGISIMKMDQGLDTGPLLLQRELAILAEDDSGTLQERLAEMGARMIVEALAEADRAAVAQAVEGVTYAAKITGHDALLDWNRSSIELERVVRAMRPAPGALAALGAATRIKVWQANLASGEADPGTIMRVDPSGIVIACGDGALRLQEVQRSGGRRLPAAEFLRGTKLAAGDRLLH